MNQKLSFGTPLGSKSTLNNNKSLFHEFVRPMSQLASKHASSPFKSSPQHDSFDFIPLSYSSPVNNKVKGGSYWRGNNRKSFAGSPSSLSSNSNFSPYNVNRKYHNSPDSSYNSNCNSYSGMNRSRKFSSDRRRGNNFLVNSGHSDNIELYYHPSMLEDPWAELEQKLQNSMADQNSSLGRKDALEKSVSNLSSVDSLASLSDSDEEADSQETDSTERSDGSS